MRAAPLEYGCWPTAAQRLLLRACLLEGPAAIEAFAAWQRLVDIDTADPGSVRLLPLLSRRLTDARIESPLIGRLRGISRQTWYKNSLLIGHVAELLRRLQAAGIPTLALKGVALGPLAYGQIALRPMADADLLVPASHARGAAAALREAGWAPAHAPDEWPPRFTASRSFVNDIGLELDLHIHVMHECLDADADEEFWAAAVPLDVGGVATRALCPADQLLHVLTHGYRPSPLPPVRWVADAAMVIRSAGATLEWGRLVVQARKRRVSLIVDACLRYLAEQMEAPVPADVLATLARTPVGRVERLERWARADGGWARLATSLWCEYRRSAGREPDWSGPLGLPRYVRDRLALPSTGHLPHALWDKVRIRRQAARRRGRAPA